jgi:hypothetical protein
VRIARYTDRNVREVEELKRLFRQLTNVEDKALPRLKIIVFDYVGGISKILSGKMDSNDASYYAKNVSNLEKERLEFLSLSKEQVTG